MAQLPVCSGADAIRAFERAGWIRVRQRGSHVSLHKPEMRELLTVPLHSTLDRGMLQSLIRKAGLSVEEFNALRAS
jgi:predicted RNA binding protein YcfA (HicA-like mRNA interferase family)